MFLVTSSFNNNYQFQVLCYQYFRLSGVIFLDSAPLGAIITHKYGHVRFYAVANQHKTVA